MSEIERQGVLERVRSIINLCQEKGGEWYRRARKVLTELEKAIAMNEEDFLTALYYLRDAILATGPFEVQQAIVLL
jgi:predicted secreted protein